MGSVVLVRSSQRLHLFPLEEGLGEPWFPILNQITHFLIGLVFVLG
jgi:hypothetical protein